MASKQLQRLRLDSVRSKILAFSVLATLIPAVATVWLAYAQGRRALSQTIATEMVGVSSQTANELGLWLKERQYDLRIFSNSYEVAENLQRVGAGRGAIARAGTDRLSDYLNSVRERTTDYGALVVFDIDGQPVAGSPAASAVPALPRDWQARLKAGETMVGTPVRDSASQVLRVVLALPIQSAGSRPIGAIAARVDLRGAVATLERLARGHAGTIYLVSYTGERFLSSKSAGALPLRGRIDGAAMRRLNSESQDVTEYVNPRGTPVIGTLRSVGGTDWAVLTEISQAEGFGLVNRFRNFTMLVLTGLFTVVGLLAYLLGLLLVRPLNRLTRGAARVAAGDLSVVLPETAGGELGYLTRAFNNMVATLRASGAEVDAAHERLRQYSLQLERLSLTDPLTGLFNRRHLMTVLEQELKRAGRTGEEFALLLMDVDHFKTYNDAFGHQAGDDALVAVARLLEGTVREVDCAARYGGEEFVVLLPATGIVRAAEVAERICEAVRHADVPGGEITVSVGVASFPSQGINLDALIASADGALYHAKREGRDCVVRADWAALGEAPATEEDRPRISAPAATDAPAAT